MPIALLLKALPYLAAIGLAFGALWWHSNSVDSFGEVKFKEGENATQAEWDKAKAAAVKAALDASIENQRRITELEKNREKADSDLEWLRTHPTIKRVYLPSSTACGDMPNSSSGSAVPTTTTERTSDAAQLALDDFKQGVDNDAVEWSRALNACAVTLEWAKSLKCGNEVVTDSAKSVK